MAHEVAEEVVAAMEPVARGPEAVVAGLFDRGTKRCAHAVVGVEAEHPVVLRLRNGECLLATETVERSLDHASAGGARDGHGVVGGTAVHHHHVVAERRGRRQAIPNAIGLVLGDHAKGKGPCGHRECHQVRGRVGSRHNAMSSSAECRP